MSEGTFLRTATDPLNFFGGSSSAPDPQESTTTVQTQLSPEQRQLLNLVFPVAEQFVTNPPQPFPDSTIVPFSPLEQQGQQFGLDFALNQLPQLIQGPQQGLDFLSSGAALFPESNPALAAAIEAAVRPLTDAFSQQILPGIRSDAINVGQVGSSREGVAQGLASQSLLRGVGDVSATLQNQAFQNALDNMTRSLAFAPGIIGLGGLQSDILSAIGAQGRGLEQAELNEQINRFSAEQLLPFQAAQAVAQLAFGLGNQGTVANSIVPAPFVPEVSRGQSALGGASTGASIGSLFGPYGTAIGGGLGALLGLLSTR